MKKALVIAIGLIFFGVTAKAQHFPRANCTTLVGDAMLKEEELAITIVPGPMGR